MAVLNGAPWIAEAIASVFAQTFQDWELIVVDNGSDDQTLQIVRSYNDQRIRVFQEDRQGVSFARNCGLKHAEGPFICFLDSDDRLPSTSLESRLLEFERHSDLCVVDGQVDSYLDTFNDPFSSWIPKRSDGVLENMLSLSSDHFRGITFMVKKDKMGNVMFREDMRHGEDFTFLIDVMSQGGGYGTVSDAVYDIRHRKGSAMSDLEGISMGYRQMYDHRLKHPMFQEVRGIYIRRVRRILFRSYLKKLNFYDAAKSWWEWTMK